jgi:hypothetical protein
MRKPITLLFVIALFTASCGSPGVAADNASCWGDSSRKEISCTALTERFLDSLHFAIRKTVLHAMKAEGIPFQQPPDTLHFIGNAGRGAQETGDLNVTFKDDRVVIVQAFIDQDGAPLEYLWNVDFGRCSDFPGSKVRCNDR